MHEVPKVQLSKVPAQSMTDKGKASQLRALHHCSYRIWLRKLAAGVNVQLCQCLLLRHRQTWKEFRTQTHIVEAACALQDAKNSVVEMRQMLSGTNWVK